MGAQMGSSLELSFSPKLLKNGMGLVWGLGLEMLLEELLVNQFFQFQLLFGRYDIEYSSLNHILDLLYIY